jgi:hypothetical protein
MPPFVKDVVGGLLRTLLAGLMSTAVAWLAKRGFAIEATQAEQIVSWAVGLLLIAGWSTWTKFRTHQVTATMGAAANLTVAQVEGQVKAGLAPSVLTPKDEVPVVPPTTP